MAWLSCDRVSCRVWLTCVWRFVALLAPLAPESWLNSVLPVWFDFTITVATLFE